tara:strand:- start:588 stop:995 length:408 start_codon:yes stop_codon:yes gene_type:complete
MADDTSQSVESMKPDIDNLYREESFTDLRAASIKRLTPVTANGEDDPGRPTQYIGDTTLMTQMGPIPVQFPLAATSFSEAFEMFPEGVKSAIERLQERAQEMAREESSRIVVPGAPGGAGGPGPLTGPGGKLVLD